MLYCSIIVNEKHGESMQLQLKNAYPEFPFVCCKESGYIDFRSAINSHELPNFIFDLALVNESVSCSYRVIVIDPASDLFVEVVFHPKMKPTFNACRVVGTDALINDHKNGKLLNWVDRVPLAEVMSNLPEFDLNESLYRFVGNAPKLGRLVERNGLHGLRPGWSNLSNEEIRELFKATTAIVKYENYPAACECQIDDCMCFEDTVLRTALSHLWMFDNVKHENPKIMTLHVEDINLLLKYYAHFTQAFSDVNHRLEILVCEEYFSFDFGIDYLEEMEGSTICIKSCSEIHFEREMKLMTNTEKSK